MIPPSFRMTPNCLRILAFSFCLLIASCATTQSRYSMLGPAYSSREVNCDIAIFRTGTPNRAFIKISRLDVHMEKTHFLSSDFESALPELKKQACLSGADAVIEIQEQTRQYLENRSYHVTATGIKYN